LEDLSYWLMLLSVPGIGPARFRTLVERFGSPRRVLEASLNELMSVPHLDKKIAIAVRNYRDDVWLRRQLTSITGNQIRVVCYQDDNYPARLRQIHDPPPLLFVKGSLEALSSESVAIVGTRRPSSYGRLTAERLAGDLARLGITVVSGMARGIDSVAHRATLEKGAMTIAVLGCGVDVVYPPENVRLRDAISKNGAVVSEFPMGTSPEAQNFPRRNRIISGLSLGVVVIEAGERSGALLTAEYALEQNREVFAVPGNVDAAKSRGTNALIKQGAKLVQTVEDILEELGPPFQELAEQPTASMQLQKNLTPEQKAVLGSLSSEPRHIDRITEETGFTSHQVSSVLLSLELNGLVRALPGKMYVKV